MFDPLTAKETARAALELVNEKLGRRPVVDSRKVGNAKAVINTVIPDNGETFVIELANATMASIKGYQSKTAKLTITLARARSRNHHERASSFEALLTDGKAKFDGDCTACDTLRGLMVSSPTLALIPGTSAPAAPAALAKPFAIPENDTHGIP